MWCSSSHHMQNSSNTTCQKRNNGHKEATELNSQLWGSETGTEYYEEGLKDKREKNPAIRNNDLTESLPVHRKWLTCNRNKCSERCLLNSTDVRTHLWRWGIFWVPAAERPAGTDTAPPHGWAPCSGWLLRPPSVSAERSNACRNTAPPVGHCRK